MMKFFLIASVIVLSGCAHVTTETPPLDYEKLPACLKPLKHSVKWHRDKKDHIHKKSSHYTKNSITDGFVTFLYDSEKQPIIQTAPFQETVIRLEAGEKFTNISSGDPSRWSYAVAISGKDENAQQNILVKPSLPNIQTNLVITTDRRLYNVRLVSTQTEQFTRSVNFVYSEEDIKTESNDHASDHSSKNVLIEETNDKRNIPPLHVNYHITTAGFFCKTPSWKPIRVFDDGTHTTIQFPENIAHRDLPALFVIQNGQKTCVNYRFQSPYMMLDQVFDEATLVSGVGQSQQAVMITHMDN